MASCPCIRDCDVGSKFPSQGRKPVNREYFYRIMRGDGGTDYEVYVNTRALLACQKDFGQLCNRDELMFQIVHQSQELWMKLIAQTLLDIDDLIQARQTHRVLTLFRRVHEVQTQQIQGLSILETMSPLDYQEIRRGLGRGSGQQSPGFRALRQMAQPVWESFTSQYLLKDDLTVENIYRSAYCHNDAYMVAEALAEFDECFRHFRYRHLQLVERTIGIASKSLGGQAVALLEEGVHEHFFPELWAIRSRITEGRDD